MVGALSKGEILKILLQVCIRRWGEGRGEELRRDLEQTADDLWKIYRYSVDSDEEPAFFLRYIP